MFLMHNIKFKMVKARLEVYLKSMCSDLENTLNNYVCVWNFWENDALDRGKKFSVQISNLYFNYAGNTLSIMPWNL